MTLNDMIEFCSYYYNSTAFPIRLVSAGKDEFFSPRFENEFDPLLPHMTHLIQNEQSVSYLMTKEFVFFGVIKILSIEDTLLILGPLSHMPYTQEFIKQMMFESKISLKYSEILTLLFSSLPVIPLDRFIQTLCFLNYTLNGIKLGIDDVIDLRAKRFLDQVSKEYVSLNLDQKEEKTFHNTYHYERHYLKLIENGDVIALKTLFDKPQVISPGIVAQSSIRQVKNISIANTTLVTRAAVRGGLDIEKAYQLSDIYIQQLERLETTESIYNLQYQMVFDFASRVYQEKLPVSLSPIVHECLQFIASHINESISASDVSTYIHKSRSFVSRLFKEETGVTLNTYINMRKIEEAKVMLAFSDKSLSDISHYLCFSSQSYFQNLFKKTTGMTPLHYRKSSINQ